MHISIASVLLVLHISGALSQGSTTWGTLTGEEPLVIARGGSSGLFPDQTLAAYFDTVNNSLSSTLLYCDIQLSLDSFAICRTEIDLDVSTTISKYFNGSNTYNFYGTPTKGYFAMDFEISTLLQIPVKQALLSRPYVFDSMFGIVLPENISTIFNPAKLWLNAEYPQFFAEQNLNMTQYMMAAMLSLPIFYISSPEVDFLKSILVGAKATNKTKLIFKIPAMDVTEPTTNTTYSQILSNLTYVRSFADGILVPKASIWPVSSDGIYVAESPTSLVKDAHEAGLLVFAFGFASDSIPIPHNYTYDPVKEYLQFVSGSAQAVDGVLTDYPMTASAALACFSSNTSTTNSNLGSKPLVISHNGASGSYPGCTEMAYKEAVASGASFIDCPVQITQDGIPICRESANLIGNTDISVHTEYYPQLLYMSMPLNATGIFAYNLTSKQISTLKAIMFSPLGQYPNVTRNPEYNGLYDILTLEDFLSYARNVTDVNIYINIENGYIFENEMNIDIVGPVISVLEASGFKGSSRVWVQSEDSSVLRRLKELTNYTLVYNVQTPSAVSTATVLQIQELANAVRLPKQLAIYTDPTIGFLGNTTDIVESFRSRNLSVFIGNLRNEFVTLAFDYELDPYLELHTLTQILKVDGLITDYPATARSYLNSECLKATSNYPFHLVTPGRLFMDVQLDFPIVVPTYSPIEFSEPPLAPTTIAPVGASAPSSSTSPPSSSISPSSPPPSPLNNSNSGIHNIPPHLLSNPLLLLLLSFMYFSFYC